MPDIETDWDGVIVRLRSEGESVSFPALVKEALAKIASQPLGAKLLRGIHKKSGRAMFGYCVAIMRPNGLGTSINPQTGNKDWNSGSSAVRISEANASKADTGTPTQIIWNSNSIITPDGARPSFIGLAHELIHAHYNIKGKAFQDDDVEEYATVGLAPLQNVRPITENKIRAEHNLGPRLAYHGRTTPGMNAIVAAGIHTDEED